MSLKEIPSQKVYIALAPLVIMLTVPGLMHMCWETTKGWPSSIKDLGDLMAAGMFSFLAFGILSILLFSSFNKLSIPELSKVALYGIGGISMAEFIWQAFLYIPTPSGYPVAGILFYLFAPILDVAGLVAGLKISGLYAQVNQK